MKKIHSDKCKGVYFDDDTVNSMIELYLSGLLANENGYQDMNAIQRMNAQVENEQMRSYLEDKLGEDKFCECAMKKLKEEQLQRMVENSLERYKEGKERKLKEIDSDRFTKEASDKISKINWWTGQGSGNL